MFGLQQPSGNLMETTGLLERLWFMLHGKFGLQHEACFEQELRYDHQ